MELQFPSSSFTLLLLVIFLYGLIKQWWGRHKKGKCLPPGPWKLPLIGTIHHMMTGSSSLPHHRLRELSQKHGPIMQLQLGEVPMVVVSSPQLAKEVLKVHDLSLASRPELMATTIVLYNNVDIAFAPYGDYWRQMRKICVVELLSAKNVRSFCSIREDEVFNMVDSIRSLSALGQPQNLTEEILSFTSSVVCRAAFGKKGKDQDRVIAQMKDLTVFLGTGGADIADLFPSLKFLHGFSSLRPKLRKMREEIDQIFENIINEHIETSARTERGNGESGEEDLVDVLLRIKHSDGLEFPIIYDHIKGVIFEMFGAGTSTSSTTVEWAMSEMIRNSRVMEKAQAEVRQAFKGKSRIYESDIKELKYLKLVIKETLRLHPPVPLLIPRECIKECIIGGYQVPIKTRVSINCWAIGRDPKYWYDAEKFEPERFNKSSIEFTGTHFEYIPFGSGRRICPGMSFGLANVELPLAQLLYHFNWQVPAGIKPEELDMTECFGLTVVRKNHLFLVATPYEISFQNS